MTFLCYTTDFEFCGFESSRDQLSAQINVYLFSRSLLDERLVLRSATGIRNDNLLEVSGFRAGH